MSRAGGCTIRAEELVMCGQLSVKTNAPFASVMETFIQFVKVMTSH